MRACRACSCSCSSHGWTSSSATYGPCVPQPPGVPETSAPIKPNIPTLVVPVPFFPLLRVAWAGLPRPHSPTPNMYLVPPDRRHRNSRGSHDPRARDAGRAAHYPASDAGRSSDPRADPGAYAWAHAISCSPAPAHAAQPFSSEVRTTLHKGRARLSSPCPCTRRSCCLMCSGIWL